METDINTFSMSGTPAFTGFTVLPSPSSPTDAGFRAAKKRRRDGAFVRPSRDIRIALPSLQVSPGIPQGALGMWYGGSTSVQNGGGTSNAGAITVWPTTEQGSSNFQGSNPSPRVPRQGNGQLGVPALAAEPTGCFPPIPQPWVNAYAAVSSGHTSWGSLPPSPVDYITADGLSPFSPVWLSPAPPLPAFQGVEFQPPAGPSYFSGPSLPSPSLSLTGSEVPSPVGIPLGPDSRHPYMAGGRSMYSLGGSGGQVGWHLPLHNVKDSKAQAVVTSTFDELPGDPGNAVAHIIQDPSTTTATMVNPVLSLSHDNTNALAQDQFPELTRPYVRVIQRPENEDWIKNEHSDQSDCDEQVVVPAETDLSGPFVDVAQELVNSSDSEGGRDRKKRGRFDEGLRKQTSNTRSMGACLRCHNQRVRCVPNKLDSKSPFAPCETCLSVHRDSKKTIHNLPCLRFKVTSMTVFRAGGLGLTQRFDHTKVTDVTEYPDSTIYEILMDQGLCKSPVRLRVRRFLERDGDISNRQYMDNGALKTQEIKAFCLVDAEKTAKTFKEYIYHNALDGLAEAVKDSDGMIRQTFAMIAKHCSSLPEPVKLEGAESRKEARKNPDQKEFLEKAVILWFAIRHGTYSAWLCGDELLGMAPETNPNAPNYGHVSVPRMIVAQFDSIRHERIYKKLAPQVLRTLETFLTSCNKEAWFTVFLATFLLLHQVACTCADRYRCTKRNAPKGGPESRYGEIDHPLTRLVEEVQHSAVMLLAHWQYFKRCDLMNFNWNDVGDSALMFLEPYQLKFVKDMVAHVKKKLETIPKTPAEGCWEHEYFWISQMFLSEPSKSSDWTPPETFSREKPSIGRETI